MVMESGSKWVPVDSWVLGPPSVGAELCCKPLLVLPVCSNSQLPKNKEIRSSLSAFTWLMNMQDNFLLISNFILLDAFNFIRSQFSARIGGRFNEGAIPSSGLC